MRLLVCGGRHYRDRDRVFATLDRIHDKRPITAIIEGAATGADALAAEWAMNHDINLAECYGGGLTEFMASLLPDGAVAFGGGTGTAHMISVLKRRGITVMEVDRGDAWVAEPGADTATPATDTARGAP